MTAVLSSNCQFQLENTVCMLCLFSCLRVFFCFTHKTSTGDNMNHGDIQPSCFCNHNIMAVSCATHVIATCFPRVWFIFSYFDFFQTTFGLQLVNVSYISNIYQWRITAVGPLGIQDVALTNKYKTLDGKFVLHWNLISSLDLINCWKQVYYSYVIVISKSIFNQFWIDATEKQNKLRQVAVTRCILPKVLKILFC